MRHDVNPLRDENERKPLRAKSVKVLSVKTWCMHATDKIKHVPFPYLCWRGYFHTYLLSFFFKMLLCLVPLTKYHETSSLQDASVVALLVGHFLLEMILSLMILLSILFEMLLSWFHGDASIFTSWRCFYLNFIETFLSWRCFCLGFYRDAYV